MWRKKGIIGLLIFVLLVFAAIYFLTDAWLESEIEDNGTQAVGAKVEIDNLRFSLLSLQLGWDRLQVTDPANTMTNMVETDSCEFNFDFVPLLSGKVIVEDFIIKNVRNGTPRETDGRVELPVEEDGEPSEIDKAITALEKDMEDAAILNLEQFTRKVNADSILALLEIKSPQKIDSLQKSLTQKYDSWNEKISNIKVDEDYKRIEKKITAIKIDEIKRADQVITAVNMVTQIKKDVDSLRNLFNETQKEVRAEISQTGNSISLVDDWIQQDYQSAMSKAKLPDLSAENIGQMLFGKKVVNNLNNYLNYIDKAREYYSYVESDEVDKEEKTPRLEGQDIYFYKQNVDPDFWLKNIELSGAATEMLFLNGNVKNIVSDQRLIGQPTSINIGGKGIRESLQFDGILNYLDGNKKEEFVLKYNGISLDGISLSDSKLMPNNLQKGLGFIDANLNLNNDEIFGEIKFDAKDVIFDFSNSETNLNEAEKFLQNLIKGVDNINFTAKIEGKTNNLKFSLKSNLDKLFADNLKSMLGDEVQKLKNQINEKVNNEVTKYKTQFDGFVDAQKQQLDEKLAKYGLQLDSLNGLLEGKFDGLEKKKKELEGSLKDKVLEKIF